MKSTRRVLGHSLVRSLVRSHCPLICSLCTAHFARTLRCAHLFVRSLTRLLPSSWERGGYLCELNTSISCNFYVHSSSPRPTSGLSPSPQHTPALSPRSNVSSPPTTPSPRPPSSITTSTTTPLSPSAGLHSKPVRLKRIKRLKSVKRCCRK